MSADPSLSRRPLKSRSTGWARACAQWLLRLGCTPNGVSVASVAFALAGAVCFYFAPRAAWCPWLTAALWLGAAAGIQLRLLCNLMDGMLAVEGGLKTPDGAIYNEAPDRAADILLLAAAGIGAAPWQPWAAHAGWAAAALAVCTAYIRALGASLTNGVNDFRGPMAKPHRMALLTAGCFLAMGEQLLFQRPPRVTGVALALIAAGSLLTCARRLRGLARALREQTEPRPPVAP